MCAKCYRITEEYTAQIRPVTTVIFNANETYLATIHREQKTRCVGILHCDRPSVEIFLYFFL